MNEIKAAENRQIRGEVLNALRLNYPNLISEKQIIVWLEQLGYATYEDIKEFLEYLQDKGYISLEIKCIKSYRQKNTMVKLTPKGIDLLESSIDPDPGIDF